MTRGQSPGSSATPGHSPRPPSAALSRMLPGWNYSEVVVGSNLHFVPPTLCDATHTLLSTPLPPAVQWLHVHKLDIVFNLRLDGECPSLNVSIIDVCYCVPHFTHIEILPCFLTPRPLWTLDFKTGGSFPRPHVLTPTHSTTRLASQTETPLQSAPSVSHLVRAFMPRQIGCPLCFWAVTWELGLTSP